MRVTGKERCGEIRGEGGARTGYKQAERKKERRKQESNEEVPLKDQDTEEFQHAHLQKSSSFRASAHLHHRYLAAGRSL